MFVFWNPCARANLHQQKRALKLCSATLTDASCAWVRNCSTIVTKAKENGFPIVGIPFYYMASSMIGQYEPNPALWLATQAAKIHLARSGLPDVSRKKNFTRKPHSKSLIDQACSAKMAGYWPRTFFASFWTSTPSLSVNTQKKNLANIQPSWP